MAANDKCLPAGRRRSPGGGQGIGEDRGDTLPTPTESDGRLDFRLVRITASSPSVGGCPRDHRRCIMAGRQHCTRP